MKLHTNKQLFLSLIDQISKSKKIDKHIIERDYWIACICFTY
jgi:hypothetical protein